MILRWGIRQLIGFGHCTAGDPMEDNQLLLSQSSAAGDGIFGPSLRKRRRFSWTPFKHLWCRNIRRLTLLINVDAQITLTAGPEEPECPFWAEGSIETRSHQVHRWKWGKWLSETLSIFICHLVRQSNQETEHWKQRWIWWHVSEYSTKGNVVRIERMHKVEFWMWSRDAETMKSMIIQVNKLSTVSFFRGTADKKPR
jgi:hypothetical protein